MGLCLLILVVNVVISLLYFFLVNNLKIGWLWLRHTYMSRKTALIIQQN